MVKKNNYTELLKLLNEIKTISSFQMVRLNKKSEVNKELFLRQATEFMKSYCDDILIILEIQQKQGKW